MQPLPSIILLKIIIDGTGQS